MQPGGQSLYASTLSQLAQSASRLGPVPDGVEYQVLYLTPCDQPACHILCLHVSHTSGSTQCEADMLLLLLLLLHQCNGQDRHFW